jgi:hypothetical protein
MYVTKPSWLAVGSALVGGLAAAALLLAGGGGGSRLAAQPSAWHRPLDGLWGDRVVGLVMVGQESQGTRSMLLLPRGAGLFRPRSDGSGWDPVTVYPGARRDLVLTIAPAINDTEQRTVFAGLGRPLPLFARSDDFGFSWTTFAGPTGPRRFDLLTACHSGRIYAAEADSQETVWTSDDRGATWQPHQALPAGKPLKALLAAPDASVVYMIVGDTLYRSDDQPDSWNQVLGPGTTTVAMVYLAAAGKSGRVFAAAQTASGPAVLGSRDRGETWPNRGWPDQAPWSPRAMAVGDHDSQSAVWLGLGDGGIRESIDGAVTWTNLARLALPARVIMGDPVTGDIWAGSDGLGLYRVHPTLLHTGAVPVEVLAVTAPTYNDDQRVLLSARVLPEERDLFSGVRPARYGVFESTGGDRWTRRTLTTSLGTNLLASPGFAADRRLYSGRLESADGGGIWQELPPAPGGGVPYVAAVGPITGTRPVVYALREPYVDGAGGKGLLRSEKGGQLWEETEGPQDRIAAVVVSPNYVKDRTVFIATDVGFIYEATDGLTFLQVGRVPTVNPTRSLYGLAISANFAQDRTLVAIVDDPSAPLQHAHVYISSKAGRPPWQDRSQGLAPDAHLRSLQLSPNFGQDGVAFLGTQTDGVVPAVYASSGDQWLADLALSATTVLGFAWGGELDGGRVFAAAGPLGLWVRDLTGPPVPEPSPTSTSGGTPTATRTEVATPTATPTMAPETPSATPTAGSATATETPTPTLPVVTPSLTVSPMPSPPTASPTATPAGTPPPRRIYCPFAEKPR